MTDPGVTAGGRPAIVVDLARAGFTDAVEVGRGGFGVVFRCTQEALNRTVAVKLLHTDLDTVSRERFFREGRAMGGLSGHPNVVDVLQVGVTHSGRPYIVMPFQSLDSLAVRVRREGPIQWQEATRMGVRLAGALECAHRVGTLHRDIKPANILLSDYGEAQLTDFGIARIEGGFETATGAFTGSLSYSAPEVLNGRPPTRQSDIYGLAAALFSIIAGRAAFERREGEEIIAQFLRITGQPIPDLRGHGVPDELCAVLERAMAKDPADRPRLGRGVRARAAGGAARRGDPGRGDGAARGAAARGQERQRRHRGRAVRGPFAAAHVEPAAAGRAAVGGHVGRGRRGVDAAHLRRLRQPARLVEPVEHVEPGTGHRAAAPGRRPRPRPRSRAAGVDGATVVVGRPGSTGWPSPGPRSGDTGPGHFDHPGASAPTVVHPGHRPGGPGRIRPGSGPPGSTPPPLPAPQPPSPDRRSRRLPLIAHRRRRGAAGVARGRRCAGLRQVGHHHDHRRAAARHTGGARERVAHPARGPDPAPAGRDHRRRRHRLGDRRHHRKAPRRT